MCSQLELKLNKYGTMIYCTRSTESVKKLVLGYVQRRNTSAAPFELCFILAQFKKLLK